MSWGNKGGWQGGDGPWGKTPGQPQQQPPSNDFEEMLRRSQDKFRDVFGGGGNPDSKKGLAIAGMAILLFWLASGIYRVDADEQGVVMRFGAFHRITEPGLQYHLPAPIEAVYKPKVTQTNQVEIGFRSTPGRTTASSMVVPEESLMLTGDENIVDINFVVQWKVRDAKDYLFNVRNPEDTVKAVGESAMREIIGQNQVSTALSSGEGKLKIELATRDLIQKTLDNYKAGIVIEKVNMGKAEPPDAVIEAFRDVQRAQTDQERARNEAEAYKNDIIPRARGQAAQIMQEAEAYKQQVETTATGDAARFVSVYTAYKQAQTVTKKRMYLETMEDILQGMNKLIVEDGVTKSGVMPYLPLPALQAKPAEAK